MASITQSAPAGLGQVVSKPPVVMRVGRIGGEERVGLERARPLQPVGRGVAREVEQQRRGRRRWRDAPQSARPWSRRRGQRRCESGLGPRPSDEQCRRPDRRRRRATCAAAQHPVGRHLVEGAEEHFGGERRIDLGCGPRRRPGRRRSRRESGRRYSRSLRRRELLHELRGLAQLDLEDDREIAVAAEAIEVQPRDPPQPIDGSAVGHGGATLVEASLMTRSKIETSRSSLP